MRQTLSQTQSQIQTLSQKQYQIYNSMLIRDMNKFYEECFNNPLLKYNRRKDVLVKDIVKFENVDDRLISEYYEHTFEEFDEATYDGLPKKKSMNKAVASTPFLVIHIEDGYLRYEVKKSLFKSFELNLNTKESLNLLPEENELFQKHLLEAKKLLSVINYNREGLNLLIEYFIKKQTKSILENSELEILCRKETREDLKFQKYRLESYLYNKFLKKDPIHIFKNGRLLKKVESMSYYFPAYYYRSETGILFHRDRVKEEFVKILIQSPEFSNREIALKIRKNLGISIEGVTVRKYRRNFLIEARKHGNQEIVKILENPRCPKRKKVEI